MPRAKQRTPELRARVLDVAVSLLAEEGQGALTTRRVAHEAGTSPPAVYELFGDKTGLLRAVFLRGFQRLHDRLETLPATEDARADLASVILALRAFAREEPMLASVMFSRSLAELAPDRRDRAVADGVRKTILSHVQRCIDSSALVGDATDIAHVVLALALGLAAQERAGWLGTSKASRDRRWDLALKAIMTSFERVPPARRG